MTPHNSAQKGDIAKLVIMPGDPLRSKFIAENYLDDYEIVSKVRGNYVYTGHYRGTRVTIMASGMGISSTGIYVEELYRDYDVETIIRVGTCGSYKKDINLFDIIIAGRTYSETNFPLTHSNEEVNIVYPTQSLNDKITDMATELDLGFSVGDVICTDSFYMDDLGKFFERMPSDIDPMVAEMESFVLFYLAAKYNRKAACVLSVSDIIGTSNDIMPEEREKGLKHAILLSLESLISH